MESEKLALWLNPESDDALLRQTAKTLLRACKTKDAAEAAAKLLNMQLLDVSRDEWSAGGPALSLGFVNFLPKLTGFKANFQKVAISDRESAILEALQIPAGQPFAPLLGSELRRQLRTLALRGVAATQAFPAHELARFTELEELDLSNCLPEVLDRAHLRDALRNCKRLKILTLAQLHLKECFFVAELENLEQLDLSDNDLTKLPNLSALQKLSSLKFAKNMVTDLDALSGLRKLKTLDFSENSVDSLAPLERLRELRTLRFSRNKVRELKPLRDLDMLETVSLSMNPVHEDEIEDVFGRRVRVE